MTVDETLLRERLARITKARDWPPELLIEFERFVREATDAGLFRVNPRRWAADRAQPERAAIDLFLYAAWAGLFHIDWSLLCPACGDEVESFRTLKNVSLHFRCTLCRTTNETNLDDFIHVSFTVAPLVRRIAFHDPLTLSAEDFYFKYRFHAEARRPDGKTFVQLIQELQVGLDYVEPGATRRFELDLAPGWLVITDAPNNALVVVALVGEPTTERRVLRYSFDRDTTVSETPQVAPGPLTIEITNAASERSPVLIFWEPEGMDVPVLDFGPVLTGKQVLSTQTFRTLFNNETVQGAEGLSVKDITILFTDLKGSTAMYDRIGDLKAFAIVQQHFDSLRRVIDAHQGAIVKTIGDAIMATFLQPRDAVRAGIAMLEEIESFNRTIGRDDIMLKVGIHRGASIAVTLNERLDYFGQTVNIAARVQGLADAREIYITEEVSAAPGVGELLGSCAVEAQLTQVKGVREQLKVFRIAPRA